MQPRDFQQEIPVQHGCMLMEMPGPEMNFGDLDNFKRYSAAKNTNQEKELLLALRSHSKNMLDLVSILAQATRGARSPVT